MILEEVTISLEIIYDGRIDFKYLIKTDTTQSKWMIPLHRSIFYSPVLCHCPSGCCIMGRSQGFQERDLGNRGIRGTWQDMDLHTS